jgi:hypothetical protein
MEVGHLFFDYFQNFREVDLRYAHGSAMMPFFEEWLRDYPDPYPKNTRYRKRITYDWVIENGTLLMTIKNGEVIYPKLEIVSPPLVVEPSTDV